MRRGIIFAVLLLSGCAQALAPSSPMPDGQTIRTPAQWIQYCQLPEAVDDPACESRHD